MGHFKSAIFLLLISFLSVVELAEVEYAPTVKITTGQVRGIVQSVEDGRKIHLYQGIRFGRAGRFEKPKPVEPWTGVYEATHLRDNCPQPGLEIEKGYLARTNSEDCLLLSVWKPIEERANRSVMFYIYGGGFKTGSIFKTTHDGRYIAARGDVIVVGVNYRLGAFGFMYGGDEDAPGNLGLLDQILALKWVQDNIHYFGGDPNSVTIFGNSAGTMCVGALMLSPLSKGLFQRAILQSGVPIGIGSSVEKNSSLTKTPALAKVLDCDDGHKQMTEIVHCLKNRTMDQILKATKQASVTFVPVYGDDFLPLKPVDALQGGHYHADIDLLYGIVRDEASSFVAAAFPPLWQDRNFTLTLDTVRQDITKMLGKHLGATAAEFYLNRVDKSAHFSQNELKAMITKPLSDFAIGCGVILFGEQFARHQAAHQKRKFYSWMLTRPAGVHILATYIPESHWASEWMGVRHADELFLLFTIPVQTKKEDIQLSNDFIRAWTNFAKTGEPGSVGKVQWTPALSENSSHTSFMALIIAHIWLLIHTTNKLVKTFGKLRFLFKSNKAFHWSIYIYGLSLIWLKINGMPFDSSLTNHVVLHLLFRVATVLLLLQVLIKTNLKH